MLSARMQQIAENLKAYCEKGQNLVAANV